MGNILGKVKEITKNKNTVTILIVLIGIFALYFVYNHIVSVATEPIMVPYATNTLPSRHVITSDDISFIEVAGGVLSNMDGIIEHEIINNIRQLTEYMTIIVISHKIEIFLQTRIFRASFSSSRAWK